MDGERQLLPAQRREDMMKLISALAVTFALAASSAVAAGRKLPDEILGLWCQAPQSNAEYTFFERRSDCDNDEMLIGPERLRQMDDCRILRVRPQESRRGPLYQLTLRCEGEGFRYTDQLKIWLLHDGLMLRWGAQDRQAR
jgi:hypothetical protein